MFSPNKIISGSLISGPWIVPVLALTLGIAVGYVSGRSAPADKLVASKTQAGWATGLLRSERAVMRSSDQSDGGRRTAAGGLATRVAGGASRIQAMLNRYSEMTTRELSEEASKLESAKLPAIDRFMAQHLLFSRWAEVDPVAAVAFASTMGLDGNFAKSSILQSWASVDPVAAAKYLANNSSDCAMMNGSGRSMDGRSHSSIIATEWARVDPSAALAWAGSLAADKEGALSAVVGVVAGSDLKMALRMFGSLEGNFRREACQAVAKQYGAEDFNEARAWIHSLPESERADALSAAICGLADRDPVQAAGQIALMSPGPSMSRALEQTVDALKRSHPEQAAKLLNEAARGHDLNDGLWSLMPVWIRKDADAALSFAKSFEAAPERDAALRSYVWSNTLSDPRELIRVAGEIEDERERGVSTELVASRWMRSEPVAAREFIEQSNAISAPSKQRILQVQTETEPQDEEDD